MSEDSVSQWLEGLKAGDRDAVQKIWDRYFDDLLLCARRKLRQIPKRTFDEDDVAQSAFLSLCRGAEAGRFPKLKHRDDLWQLLVMLARDKVVNQIRNNTRRKRGAGAVRGDSIFHGADCDAAGFDEFLGKAPDPQFLVVIDEEFQRLLKSLRTDEQRQIAVLRMEGYTYFPQP